jgi:hypothetical protein
VPKSLTRKKAKTLPLGAVPMTDRIRDAMLEQRKAFIDKLGREPGPGDPVFFDPDKDVPTPISPERMNADLERALRDSGIDPVKVEPARKRLG